MVNQQVIQVLKEPIKEVSSLNQTNGIRKIIEILRMVAKTGKYEQSFGWGNLKDRACALSAIALEYGFYGHTESGYYIQLDKIYDMLGIKYKVESNGDHYYDTFESCDYGCSIVDKIISWNDHIKLSFDQIADRLESQYLV